EGASMTRRLVTFSFVFCLIVGGVNCGDDTQMAPDSAVDANLHDAGPDAFDNSGAMNVEQVGHEPLFDRGMNAGVAIYQNIAYIGNRTDGSNHCGLNDPRIDMNHGSLENCPHPHAGGLIVDINDPAKPQVIGELGPS